MPAGCRPAAGLGAGLDERDELEDGVVGKRREGDRLLVGDGAEAEGGELVSGVGGQLEDGVGTGRQVRGRRGGEGGQAERSSEADDPGEDEAGDEAEDGHLRSLGAWRRLNAVLAVKLCVVPPERSVLVAE